MLPERPPSYAQSHDPSTLQFPAAPTTQVSSINHARILPPISAIRPEAVAFAEPSPFAWPSSNPLTAYYQPGPSQLSPKNKSIDSPGGMDIDTPDSRGRRGGSVLSIDDPDVRIAAEALGDLRAGTEILHSSPAIPISSTNMFYCRFHPIISPKSQLTARDIATRLATSRTSPLPPHNLPPPNRNRNWRLPIRILCVQELLPPLQVLRRVCRTALHTRSQHSRISRTLNRC
jgi:hypothetical protein